MVCHHWRFTKELYSLDFSNFVSFCEPTTSLRVVGAGFARSNRLYEGIRFVCSKKGSDRIAFCSESVINV